ncbi:MAG: hypothetical protein U0R50_13290 [Gaiellales bacterium]
MNRSWPVFRLTTQARWINVGATWLSCVHSSRRSRCVQGDADVCSRNVPSLRETQPTNRTMRALDPPVAAPAWLAPSMARHSIPIARIDAKPGWR